jgi:putative tryptophan/tyrosine transport system substrate-binding protein
MLRVGTVSFAPRSPPSVKSATWGWAAFEQRLAELGYHDGKNFTFDFVLIDSPDKSDAAYRELVERKADILLAFGPEVFLNSALAASQTTPIVMGALDYDPLARGYVTSLAQPGGRITGIFLRQIELTVKRLQFLKDALPDFNSAIVFFDRISTDQWEAATDAGAKIGVRLSGIDLHDPPYDYDRALAEAPLDNRKNLFVPTSPIFFNDRERLAKFALRNRLVSIFGVRKFVDAGGLLSYGPSFTATFRR